MPKISSGLLMYRLKGKDIEVFLVHLGGPFFAKKDGRYWGIPKGEVNDGEELLEGAMREMEEETGIKAPDDRGRYIELGEVKMKSGKIIHVWAFEGDWSGLLICKTWVSMQGKNGIVKFPEVDRAGFFGMEKARKKMNAIQWELVERLKANLSLV